jgi:signal transduction histidine kinase
MNLLPVSVLYTQDQEMPKQLGGFLGSVTTVRHVREPGELTAVLHQYDPTLLFLDLQSDQWRQLLAHVRRNMPNTLVMALGPNRSEPALEASGMGICVLDTAPLGDRLQLRSVVSLAISHLQSVRETHTIKRGHYPASLSNGNGDSSHTLEIGTRPALALPALPLQYFSRAFRNFDDIDAMLESIIEGVAGYAKVSRAGVFSVGSSSDVYRLRASLRCLPQAQSLEFSPDDPLVRWLEIHAHLVARINLPVIPYASERLLLEQTLTAMGAEVIIPLHGRRRLIGWLFVGHPITGLPYTPEDLESLMTLGEYVSVTLENALLYEEVTVQKTLAETVLHAIPVGIVAVGSDDMIRWYNKAAETILDFPREKALNQPARLLTSRLAGLLADCIEEGPRNEPAEWVDPASGRYLSVLTRPLTNGRQCLGAVAIVNDLSKERLLVEKQHRLERAAFWTELAAAMSHEVRNPLVAVSTFAQLLPERYQDADFRDEFSQLVAREIGRLTGMIDQINMLATSKEPAFRPLEVDDMLSRAVKLARQQHPSEKVNIHLAMEQDLPRVEGDTASLTECFAHLIVNAVEATENTPGGAVTVSAKSVTSNGRRRLVVRVQDNGKGIPEEIRERIFSPFFSTKARGIGLGLALARRTATDHSGQITVDSGKDGTTVTVVLPFRQEKPAETA